MIQNLKMFGHFVAWCSKHVFTAVWETLMTVLIFPRFIASHYEEGKRQFRQNFAYGLLNYVLSLFVTFAFCSMTAMILFGVDLSSEDRPKMLIMYSVAVGLDTLFYFVCFMSVTYEKFLADYEHVFTLLKEKDDV